MPEDFPYQEARDLFLQNTYPASDLDSLPDLMKWDKPDNDSVKDFLIKEKNFNEEKVDNGLKKLNKFSPT